MIIDLHRYPPENFEMFNNAVCEFLKKFGCSQKRNIDNAQLLELIKTVAISKDAYSHYK